MLRETTVQSFHFRATASKKNAKKSQAFHLKRLFRSNVTWSFCKINFITSPSFKLYNSVSVWVLSWWVCLYLMDTLLQKNANPAPRYLSPPTFQPHNIYKHCASQILNWWTSLTAGLCKVLKDVKMAHYSQSKHWPPYEVRAWCCLHREEKTIYFHVFNISRLSHFVEKQVLVWY